MLSLSVNSFISYCGNPPETISFSVRIYQHTAKNAGGLIFPPSGPEEIFYSDLYHPFVKPADWSDDSFVYGKGPFVADLATLWDMYKTVPSGR